MWIKAGCCPSLDFLTLFRSEGCPPSHPLKVIDHPASFFQLPAFSRRGSEDEAMSLTLWHCQAQLQPRSVSIATSTLRDVRGDLTLSWKIKPSDLGGCPDGQFTCVIYFKNLFCYLLVLWAWKQERGREGGKEEKGERGALEGGVCPREKQGASISTLRAAFSESNSLNRLSGAHPEVGCPRCCLYQYILWVHISLHLWISLEDVFSQKQQWPNRFY